MVGAPETLISLSIKFAFYLNIMRHWKDEIVALSISTVFEKIGKNIPKTVRNPESLDRLRMTQ